MRFALIPEGSPQRTAVKVVWPAGLVVLLAVAAAASGARGGDSKPTRDRSAPTIAIAAVQQTGPTTMVVTGTASDDVGVTEVDVRIDGGSYWPAQGTATWSFAFDPTALASGTHTATARALDASGKSATASVSFSVGSTPGADTTSPTVSFARPATGASMSGTIAVAGSAADNAAVAKVDVRVDGGAYQTASGTVNWSTSLDTTALTSGIHTLTARATDTSGNVGTTSETVNVANDTGPPTVAITAPAAGSTVSGAVAVSGTAADDTAVASVAVSVDGGPYQAASGTTSWTRSIDTTALANGSHAFTARATDTSGKTTVSAGVTVTVGNTTSGGSHLVTPEGVTIDVASDVTGWTAQQVYDLLKPNAYELAKLGPSLKVKVQTQYASQTTSGAVAVGGVYTSFSATIYLKATADASFPSIPDAVIAHEYGCAWTQYHLWLSQGGNWTPYLTERNLLNDPRLDSNLNWSRNELIADDYRLLFGTAAAQSEQGYINPYIPDPRTVPGLRDWFVNTWAVP